MHAYKVMDCTTGKLVVSIHVTFDELDSVASQELKRNELRKLGQNYELTFDYYSRQASQDIDFLFNGDTTMTALNEEEINALESFVQHFNLWDDDSGETNLVEAYGGCFQVSGLTFKATDSNLVKVSKLQAKSCWRRTSVPIPRSFQEAMASDEKDHWEATIRKELDSIKANGTWKYVQSPEDRKPLKTTWVFRVKEKSDGTIERFKARLVVKDFLLIKGLDYSGVFAPVMRLESLRTLLAVANAHDLPVDQMDIDTAFLNGILQDTIYIDLPEGFSVEDILDEIEAILDEIDWVGANPTAADVKRVACLLVKALSCLKQSPREWHKVLTAFSARMTNGQQAIIAIYVDDLVLVAQNDHVMADLKSAIKQRFASKDMGPIHYILGLKIIRDRKKRLIHISQPLNALNMLKRFQLDRARPAMIPLNEVLKASDSPTEDQSKSEAYAAMHARKKHFGEMKRIMRYVAGTMSHGLLYRGSELDMCGYTDSDYAANPDNRRSVSGYCTFVGKCLVSWASQTQGIVAQSTTEAEYIALAQAAKEVLFMKTLNCELGNPIKTGSIIRVDNQPAMATACNPYFVRERVQLEELKLEYVPSRDNVADFFTKPLVAAVFVPLREKLGLCLPPVSPSTPTTTTNSAHPSAHQCNSACTSAPATLRVPAPQRVPASLRVPTPKHFPVLPARSSAFCMCQCLHDTQSNHKSLLGELSRPGGC
ncbi:hypothetical protein Ae201684P_015436 [Aphanomyces euteiches]|nr:hypothetical protein Ae201684P_015436 [Aphanomyces euteiches]